MYALLLTDILVLLSKVEDGSGRLLLKRYHIESVNGVRDEIIPIIRLKEVILRHFASDRGTTYTVYMKKHFLHVQ